MSFDWSVLVPLEVGVTVTVVPFVLNLFGRKKAAELAIDGRYEFSIGLRMFIWLGVFLTISFPMALQLGVLRCGLNGLNCDTSVNTIPIGFRVIVPTLFVLILTSIAVWMGRYRVLLMDNCLEIGDFRKIKVRYDAVTSLDVVTTSRGTPFVCLSARNGRKLKIDGNLQNFDDLVKKLTAKIDAAKATQQTAQPSTWL